MDAGARPGDDDVDLRRGDGPPCGGDGHKDRFIRIHLDRQRVVFDRGVEDAHDGEEQPVHFDDQAHRLGRSGLAHLVCDVGANDAERAVDVEV